MTIERLVFSIEPFELRKREQLAVGQTIDLGRKSLNKEFLDSELYEDYVHKVTVKSHDEVVDKVIDGLGNGNYHTKTRDYINKNPPWGIDEEGNIIVLFWEPTVYGENGDKQTIGLSL